MACRSAYISQAAMARRRPCWRSPPSWRQRNGGPIACRHYRVREDRKGASRVGFVDADDTLAAITEKLQRDGDPPVARQAVPGKQ